MKRNRSSHWSINKLITANDRIGDTCCRIETITGHQFTEMLAARAPQAKTLIFSLIFSDLKRGFFYPNIGEKKRFGIGNITV